LLPAAKHKNPHKFASFRYPLRQNNANNYARGEEMATYRKRGNSWRAEVSRNGIRESGSFDTKAEAVAWATKVESEIMAGARGKVANKTFGELLVEYRDKVSATKRGERWERMRIDRLVYGRPDDSPPVLPDPLAAVKLDALDAPGFTAWRDRRLRQVTPSSVRREWNLLSAAINVAINEWQWIPRNPMKTVKRPPPSAPRDRRISADEIERLCFALGYDQGAKPETQTARVGAAFLLAIETGMRAGEICALRWGDLFLDDRYLSITGAAIGAGKTVAARRNVPLSTEAVRILRQLEGVKKEGESVFRITSGASIDAIFRKAKAKAMIDDLHFHDTRHEAITRLAKKIDVLDLARAVGHKDLRQLMTYYNETASEIAGKLD
jgi:integrase